MKKTYVMLALALSTALVACKKDKDDDNNGGGGNGGGSNTTTYFLKISAESGYFADNPFNYSTTDGEYITAFRIDQSNTTRLRVSYFDSGTKDILLYFEGASTTGTKTIVEDPVNLYSNIIFTVPNEVLFIVDFPEQTPVNITKYGSLNETVEGYITGNFLHRKTDLTTSEQSEFTNHFKAEFKVKRK